MGWGFKTTIYRTRDEHTNDYTTDGGQTHDLSHSRRARERLHHRWGVKPPIYRTRNEHANDYTTDGGVEPTIYRTRDEHANDYTTDGGSTYDLPHSRRAR